MDGIGSIHLVTQVVRFQRPDGVGLRNYRHVHHVLALHTEVGGRVRVGDEEVEITGPFLILLPAGDLDGDDLIGHDEAWWVSFEGNALRRASGGATLQVDGLPVTRPRVRHLSAVERRTAITWFRELYACWQAGGITARLRLKARMFDLLAMWARPATEADDDVEHFRRLIADRACDPTVALADLARSVGRLPDTLAKGFRRQHACSPVQYRTRLRLLHVQEMLLHDPKPLVELAKESGFTDAGYLCRIFRQHLGTTPDKWLKQMRSGG